VTNIELHDVLEKKKIDAKGIRQLIC